MSVAALARVFCCYALVLVATAPIPAMAEPQQASPGGSSLCVDQMETDPDQDWEVMPIADTVDGGCMASLEPIST
jgi:hypothetical protein